MKSNSTPPLLVGVRFGISHGIPAPFLLGPSRSNPKLRLERASPAILQSGPDSRLAQIPQLLSWTVYRDARFRSCRVFSEDADECLGIRR